MSDQNFKSILIAGSIAASGTKYSDIINLETSKMIGFESIEIHMTGDGTMRVRYLLSNVPGEKDPTKFILPSGVDDIVTAFTKTSGVGADGVDLIQFPVIGQAAFAGSMVLEFTETGAANGVELNSYLKIQ